jgi:hypothetical protein
VSQEQRTQPGQLRLRGANATHDIAKRRVRIVIYQGLEDVVKETPPSVLGSVELDGMDRGRRKRVVELRPGASAGSHCH